MKIYLIISVLYVYFFLIYNVNGRQHDVKLKNNSKQNIICSQFGFLKNGRVDVTIKLNDPQNLKITDRIGLTFSNEEVRSVRAYLNTVEKSKCILSERDKKNFFNQVSLIRFRFNFQYNELDIEASSNLEDILIESQENLNTTSLTSGETKKREPTMRNMKSPKPIPLIENDKEFTVSFSLIIPSVKLQGIYTLYFHHCPPLGQKSPSIIPINGTIDLTEKNEFSYLSAGEMPLPVIYGTMSAIYVCLTLFWIYYLKTRNEMIFRMYYVMTCLLVLKSLSLLFRCINYYVLGKHGYHEEGWAVMYYITHLFKGSVLFVTIILIGTGWTYLKRVLSSNVKKLFVFIIPLQILANVASIIVEESDESADYFNLWSQIFVIVDLLCCFAVVLPVIWSIHHLKIAMSSDDKAAVTLQKMKLFRFFYVLIISYVYVTRILVYIMEMFVRFDYSWTLNLFREVTTLVFFIVTGYIFRPLSNNAYLLLPTDDDLEADKVDMEFVSSQSGVNDGLVRVNQRRKEADNSDEDAGSDTEIRNHPRENSHDYD